MRILLIGGSGLLGRNLAALLPCDAPARVELDITDAAAVREYFSRTRPEVAILAAALVGAAPCDADPARAWLVNTGGAANVARACAETGSKLVFISTAAVFDGEKGNYTEDDPPNPTYLYAITKYAGECIARTYPRHLVVRSDFFSRDGFKYDSVFTDHYTSKEPADVVAAKIVRLIQMDAVGVFHVGGPKESLFDILKPYFPGIRPLLIADSSMPRFPRDISLNTQKYDLFVGAR